MHSLRVLELDIDVGSEEGLAMILNGISDCKNLRKLGLYGYDNPEVRALQ